MMNNISVLCYLLERKKAFEIGQEINEIITEIEMKISERGAMQ